MKIEKLMARDVKACGPDDTMHHAAQIMWDNDLGCVPVIDSERRVVGMITDRDICMATLTRGLPPVEMSARDAMTNDVATIRPNDSVASAAELMRTRQVHRLPVVDANSQLVGLVSINDLAREAVRQGAASRREVTHEEVGTTLASISEPRGQNAGAEAVGAG